MIGLTGEIRDRSETARRVVLAGEDLLPDRRRALLSRTLIIGEGQAFSGDGA
jgi:hypothetical protein